MIKRMCAMVLALMLICGTALSDWYCEKCGNINPDEAAKCTIKGCGEPAPIHGLKAEAVSPYAVRLSWYGSTVKLLKILYSPAPGGDWIVAQEGVHGNEYTVEGLAPDTCYYFTLNMTSGDAGDPGISLPYEMAVTAALEPKDTEPKDTGSEDGMEPEDGAAPEAASTQEPAPTPEAVESFAPAPVEATQQPVRTGEVQRGDYVVFDAQDSADWLVLEAEADYLLLLSMHVIGLEAKHDLAMQQAGAELAALPMTNALSELTYDEYEQYADLLEQVPMGMPWWLQDGRIVAGDRLSDCTEAGVRPAIRVSADVQLKILEEGHHEDILADLDRDGHLFRWRPLDEASCSDAVEAVYMCIDCGYIVSRVFDYYAHGEIGGWEVVMQATCIEPGEQVQRCLRCGDVVKSMPISAFGQHVPGEWIVTEKATCQAKGKRVRKCTSCGMEMDPETIDALGHTPGNWFVTRKPTCTRAGERQKKCTVCGIVLNTDTIKMLDHAYGDWIISEQATCNKEGKKVRECTACNKTEERNIPPNEHSFGETQTIEATCTKPGEKYQICEKCGVKHTISTSNPLGHTEGGWVTTK